MAGAARVEVRMPKADNARTKVFITVAPMLSDDGHIYPGG
jgi:hypothetical protein